MGPNPDFLLGGRTSASAECGHWSGRAVRWSSYAILLSVIAVTGGPPRPWNRRRSVHPFPVHSRTEDQIELVDQSRAQKSTVGTAASLQ